MRRPAAAVAALVTAAVAVAAPATPAAAHTTLAKAIPAAKSTVTRPVVAVQLTFSGLVRQAGTDVQVTGPDGTDYAEGAARALDKTVTQPLAPLPVGTITVAWQTVSGDGHPIEGRYAFTNRVAPVPPAPTATSEPPVTTPPTTTPADPVLADDLVAAEEQGDSSIAAGWAAGGGAVVVIFLVLVLLRRRSRHR